MVGELLGETVGLLDGATIGAELGLTDGDVVGDVVTSLHVWPVVLQSGTHTKPCTHPQCHKSPAPA